MGDGSPTVGQVRQSLCPLVTCGLIKLPDLSHRVAQYAPLVILLSCIPLSLCPGSGRETPGGTK